MEKFQGEVKLKIGPSERKMKDRRISDNKE